MKRLIGLIFFLNGWIAYSQPIRLNKLNFDHFTVREKILSPEFSSLIPDKFLNHPELGILPFEDIPCSDCIELIDHRNAFSRYFVKKNTKGSKFFQQKASGPINYKDINGEWREINYRLRKKGSKLFVAVNQPNPVSIDLEKFIISLQNSNYRIQSKFPELIWRDKEGNEQSFGIPDFSNFTAGDDGILIKNVYSGIDFVFSVRQEEIETNFILNKRLPYNSGEIILKQQIDLPENLFFSFEKSENRKFQDIFIIDKGQAHVFNIEKGFAYDNSPFSKSLQINSCITEKKYLEFSVPLSWLSDSATTYPVIIDPKVKTQNTVPLIGIAGTKYSPVCWTNGCDYIMNVNSPSNATITKISHSFEFYATGLCFSDDGGYSIDYQTCHSPSGAPGVYTNPLHISNAYFSADTVPIPEFNACLPTPQCAPQNFNFILHFYRCNNDPDLNCAGNCIRATKPWTMFIEGYTVQLASITPTQQVCEGSSAQLIVSPQYGVSPYLYLWSPVGATTNTINVTPNVTTTYSVTVTDVCGLTTTGTSTINIVSNTNPGFTINPNPGCENIPITLNGNGTGTPNEYDWILTGSNVPGGILNDNQAPMISYSIPGNYDVILSYANGVCNFNDTVPLTVSAPVLVSVSLSSQPSVSICNGDTITFKASPVNGGLTPTYDWLVDGIIVQSGLSDSLITNTLINGSLVQVILHTSSSCATPLNDTAFIVVTLNTGLTPLVTIFPDTAVCPGSPLTLNVTTINAGVTPSYQWFANGSPIAGATSSSYSFNVTIPDTIISVQLNSSLGCVTTSLANDFTNVNILQNLQTIVTISANPSGILCDGDSVYYSANAQNGGGAPQFQWFVNGVLTSITDSVFAVLPSNNDSIRVQLTSSITCVLNSTDDDFVITSVVPSLSPSVSLSFLPSKVVCKGDTIAFTASSMNAGSSPIYTWTVNGILVNINDSIFTTSLLSNSDEVQVILNSSLACASIPSDTDQVSISVLDNVIPSVTINTLGNAICAGDSIQFVATTNNGGVAPLFQWFVNGISTGLSNDTIILAALNNGDSVQSIMSSSLNCVIQLDASSPVYVTNLQPVVMPQIDISVSPVDTICIGQQVNLKATFNNGGNSPVLQWFVNSILTPVTSATFTSTTFGQGDIIVANMTSNADCLLKSGDTSNFIRIVYYQPLDVQLTSSVPDCPGLPATIAAHASGGNGGPYHFIWSNGSIDKDSITIIAENDMDIFIQVEDYCTSMPATFLYTIPVLTGPVSNFAYVNPSPGSFQNTIQFINLSKDADSWVWIFPKVNITSTELNPLYQFPQQGTYDVILATRNNNGCVDTIKYIVSVREEIAIFYPNSFSPNGDGKNEIFQPLGASLEDYEMTIWDRWGEMIYSGDSKSAWNGMIRNSSSPAPEGVYVFRIDLKEDKFENRVVTGSVTLIR